MKNILIYKIGNRLEIETYDSIEKIKNKIEKYGLKFNEYAIVEGKVKKSFSSAVSLVSL
jgi:hypothetical protein